MQSVTNSGYVEFNSLFSNLPLILGMGNESQNDFENNNSWQHWVFKTIMAILYTLFLSSVLPSLPLFVSDFLFV